MTRVFDQEHDGVLKAIATNLFPFLKRTDDDCKKDLPIMTILSDDVFTNCSISINEVGGSTGGEQQAGGCLIGVLNGLHSRGCTAHKTQLHKSSGYEDTMTFLHRRYGDMAGDAIIIFIPNNDK